VRLRAVVALPLLAVVLAGCGASGSSKTTSNVTATGTTLRVFISDPPAVQSNQALQDVVDAEELAWTQHSASVKHVALKLVPLKRAVSDNARQAIDSNSLLAYLGEVQTGQSVQTVGILNAQDALELSPTDSVRPDKTDFEDFSTYGRTFASLPLDLTTSTAALNQALPSFATTFKTDFAHAPSPQAIEGYDSMWVLLRVLSYLGGQANNRSKIATDVVATLKGNQGQASVPAFTIKK
jgi:ABC-type branched-subunit amino acid transport system substrate-binding protein